MDDNNIVFCLKYINASKKYAWKGTRKPKKCHFNPLHLPFTCAYMPVSIKTLVANSYLFLYSALGKMSTRPAAHESDKTLNWQLKKSISSHVCIHLVRRVPLLVHHAVHRAARVAAEGRPQLRRLPGEGRASYLGDAHLGLRGICRAAAGGAAHRIQAPDC